jgi:hypothetical protein
MKPKKYFSDLTAYPKLFEPTYWARFSAEQADCNVIQARNMFVSDFCIKRNLKRPFWNSLVNDGFDHLEFYKTDYGIIMLNSPYRDDLDSIMADIGFNRLAYRIYSKYAVTYFRIFKTIKAIKEFAGDLSNR